MKKNSWTITMLLASSLAAFAAADPMLPQRIYAVANCECNVYFDNLVPDGFPGDEDNGTMALWYVFGVLGFYTFCPGKPEFVKGRKQVKRAFLCGREIDADSFDGNIIPYSALV